jgi:hypothetical protein
MIYSLGVRTVDGTIAAPNWEIRTGATPGRAKLLEIGFFLVAATASQLGLGRPAAIGTVPTAPVNFLPEDPNDVIAAGVLQSAVAWGGAPTVPAAFLRRISLPATIGTGVIWTFPKGITISVSNALVLWNIGANSLLDAYAVIEI